MLAILDAVRDGRPCRAVPGGRQAPAASPGVETHADEPRTLTARESEVLRLVTEGYSSAGIAARLGISRRTVEKHREHGMAKLGISSVAALTRFAVSHGLA